MRLNRRVVVLLVIAVFTYIGSQLLPRLLDWQKENYEASTIIDYEEPITKVVVAAIDLPAGKPITSDCIKVEKSRTQPRAGTLHSYTLAVGRIPKHAIPSDTQINEDDLVPLKILDEKTGD